MSGRSVKFYPYRGPRSGRHHPRGVRREVSRRHRALREDHQGRQHPAGGLMYRVPRKSPDLAAALQIQRAPPPALYLGLPFGARRDGLGKFVDPLIGLARIDDASGIEVGIGKGIGESIRPQSLKGLPARRNPVLEPAPDRAQCMLICSARHPRRRRSERV